MEKEMSSVEVQVQTARSAPEAPDSSAASAAPAASEDLEGPLRAETCTCCINKSSAETKVGIEFGNSKDGRFLLITAVHPGSLADAHSELRPGAKLLDVMVDGQLHRDPDVQEAATLIGGAVGEVQLTVMPLLDRFGFVVDLENFTTVMVTRDQARFENQELRKWQKRVSSAKAWQRYSTKKPEKLRQVPLHRPSPPSHKPSRTLTTLRTTDTLACTNRHASQRIRDGVPDAVRGFVWKAIAAARAPSGFRQDGLYAQLALREGTNSAAWIQIDKDVPRTMTGHIFFRGNGSQGQAALTRVLRAYAAYNPTLGYTQGMSSYAAVLLLYMSEEDGFWVFATLMQECGLVGLFSDGFPLLHHYYDRWEAVFKKQLPKLATHVSRQISGFLGLGDGDYEALEREGDRTRFMLPSLYTTDWFQTMFVGGNYPAPSALAPRIMDNILLDGNIAIIFSLGLALVGQHKKALLKLDQDVLASKLKTICSECGNTNALMDSAYVMNIREKHIEVSEEERAVMGLKERV